MVQIFSATYTNLDIGETNEDEDVFEDHEKSDKNMFDTSQVKEMVS